MSRYVGLHDISLKRDADGHRDYQVTHLIEVDPETEGPLSALACPGVSVPGARYLFSPGGTSGELDVWAWCRFDCDVEKYDCLDGERPQFYTVKQVYSTRAPEREQSSLTDPAGVGNPLLEPMRVSGTFLKRTEEADRDLYGNQIQTSSFEKVTGQSVTFDESSAQVTVEQNVGSLQLDLCAPMVDCLNDRPLWGLPPRCVKLSNFTWARKYQDGNVPYYTRRFEFDTNYSTFDRVIPDEGTKVLNGHWENEARGTTGTSGNFSWVLDPVGGRDPDRFNPAHFIRYKDLNGENARVLLDGEGKPFDPDQGRVLTRFYDRGLKSKKTTPLAGGLGATPSITDVEVIGGGTLSGSGFVTTYNYKVSALFRDGSESGPSAFATASISDPGFRTVRLEWDPVSGAVGYRVYRNGFGDPSGVYRLIGSVGGKGSSPGMIVVAKYAEANFLLLGIPTVL